MPNTNINHIFDYFVNYEKNILNYILNCTGIMNMHFNQSHLFNDILVKYVLCAFIIRGRTDGKSLN